MIRTLAVTKKMELIKNIPLDDLLSIDIAWYWVDFDCPTYEESDLLSSFFRFHPLAIEDCLHLLQRPKVDDYHNHYFFVFHSLDDKDGSTTELDLFLGEHYVVSYHQKKLEEVDSAWSKITSSANLWDDGPIYVCYQVLDKLVDHYFPVAYRFEDMIDEIDENEKGESTKKLLDQVFEIRGNLLKFRRVINQMRDLLYRMLNMDFLKNNKENSVYFFDVYDHLLRLSEMIDSCQAITTEIKDSYLSINSYRMNRIMMLLTVVTTIFIPLTFIVGIYGMNFDYMPELRWHYGYFIIMGAMAFISVMMYRWFKKKGWFDID